MSPYGALHKGRILNELLVEYNHTSDISDEIQAFLSMTYENRNEGFSKDNDYHNRQLMEFKKEQLERLIKHAEWALSVYVKERSTLRRDIVHLSAQ